MVTGTVEAVIRFPALFKPRQCIKSQPWPWAYFTDFLFYFYGLPRSLRGYETVKFHTYIRKLPNSIVTPLPDTTTQAVGCFPQFLQEATSRIVHGCSHTEPLHTASDHSLTIVKLAFNGFLIHNHPRDLHSADEAMSLNKIRRETGSCVGQPKLTYGSRRQSKLHLKSTERMSEIEKWGSRRHRFIFCWPRIM
jgi:hypothetical protein